GPDPAPAAARRARGRGPARADAPDPRPPRRPHRAGRHADPAGRAGPLPLGPHDDRGGPAAGARRADRRPARPVRRAGRDRRAARRGRRRRHHRLAADRRALRRAARARALTDRGAEPRRGGGPARRPGGGPGAARRPGRRAPAARLRALPGRPGRPAAAARQAPRGGGRLPRGARLGRHRTGARPPAATPGRPHLPLHRSGAGGWGEHPRSEAGRPHLTCPSPFSPPPEAGKNTLGQEAISQRRGRDMVRPVEERYRAVRDLFPELRIELVNGRIVVNEPGTWQHNTIIAQLLAQLAPLVAERGWEIWPNITVHLDEETDRYVPDLTIVPREPAMATDQAVRGTSTLLLVDVVSAGN